MSRIKALIFDKDGTLFPYSLWINPMRRTLTENLPVAKRRNRDEIVSAFLSVLSVDGDKIASSSLLFDRRKRVMGFLKLVTLTVKYHLNPYRAMRGFLSLRDRYFHGFREELEEYDLSSVRNTLRDLQEKGIILALFSNDSPSSVEIVTDALSPVTFSYFVDSSSRIRKPNVYSIRVFGELFGLRCDEIALVSDTPEDLMMGRKAGCGLVIGLSGTMKKEEIAPFADRVISSLDALPALLSD